MDASLSLSPLLSLSWSVSLLISRKPDTAPPVGVVPASPWLAGRSSVGVTTREVTRRRNLRCTGEDDRGVVGWSKVLARAVEVLFGVSFRSKTARDLGLLGFRAGFGEVLRLGSLRTRTSMGGRSSSVERLVLSVASRPPLSPDGGLVFSAGRRGGEVLGDGEMLILPGSPLPRMSSAGAREYCLSPASRVSG